MSNKFSSKFFVKQHDKMQCGAACLAMLCKFFGKNIALEYLSNLCDVSAEGASLKGIAYAADIIGIKSQAARVTIGQLCECPMPCVLHWDQRHFVVLYKIKNSKRFYVSDPAKGLIQYDTESFAKHWLSTEVEGQEKGIAMFFEPTAAFFDLGLDTAVEKRSFKFLASYIMRYRKYFIHIMAGLLLGCVLQLIMPFLTQMIVDVGIKQKDVSFIWLILLGELMIVLGTTATDFIRRWMLLHISMRINISLISDFFIKLLKLPMRFFDTKMMGDLMQRLDDHERVQAFLTSQILGITFTIFSFLVFGVVLFLYDKLIFAVFLLGSIVYALWTVSFLNKRKILDYELFEQLADNQNKTYQFITTMQEIKLQGCERRRRWEWEDVQADLFAIRMKSLKLQQTQEAGSIFINEIKNILITVLTATAVIRGQITFGMMLAIQYIIGQLNSPVQQFMGFIYSLQDVKISLERINEIHNSQNEENKPDNLTSFSNAADKSISLQNVMFKYNIHSPKPTVDHITFDIPYGSITAIVGASGSGKTTLIKLMLGYYRVLEGSIDIDGVDINEYNLKWWRQQCGIVMQDGVIFSESIGRNIAVSDGDIDRERLENAARIACIHDYVMSLPLKYNTIIGNEGIGLSQGQKQRILIARAVYKNPDFIFLDEATNSLDASNERAIVDNLGHFYNGRTVVVVAHRLSTVKNADQIIVMDNGEIAEIGNHDSLIANKGVYYNLVRNQLELGN